MLAALPAPEDLPFTDFRVSTAPLSPQHDPPAASFDDPPNAVLHNEIGVACQFGYDNHSNRVAHVASSTNVSAKARAASIIG